MQCYKKTADAIGTSSNPVLYSDGNTVSSFVHLVTVHDDTDQYWGGGE